MSYLRGVALAPLALGVLGAPAFAQEQTVPVQQADTGQAVLKFTPADFAAARPTTALDMINRLPGFTLESNEQVRGFAGAAGNVLIDGARPTIKTDSLSDTLARIPIDQVERIDLIRGGAPGIDMQGRTVVANVIRKRVDTFQQVVQLQGFIFAETGHTIPGWNYQATRRTGDHQFDVQLSRGTSYDDSVGFGFRTIFDPQTGATTFQDAESEGDGMVHSLRANYKGPLLGGTLAVNGLVNTDEFKDEQAFQNATTYERYMSRSANDRGEIGVNYTRPLADNLELETLVLSKIAFGAANQTGDDGSSDQFFHVEAEAGETIGRSVLRYAMSPTLAFEAGGEAAFNYREQQVALTIDGQPIPLPSSDVRVEEVRGEIFGQGTWRPTDKLTLEAGVRVERSTITQSGDTSKERSFTYPKPRVLATWALTDKDQLRLRVEREVGQLSFQDFASAVDRNSGVVSTGNSDLRPDQTWAYEAAYEHRFWDNGAVVLTLRHEDVSDVSDILPFTLANGQLVSGPGNIGDGTVDVMQLDVTLPLAKLGVEGAELKVNLKHQESSVADPTTGEDRRFSRLRPDDLRVSYRHDLPDLKLTYGLGWYGGWYEDRYLPTEVQRLRLRNFWSSFIEWKPDAGFTLRAEVNNFDPYTFIIQREVYAGRRDAGEIDYVERETRNSQVIGRLVARWSFN